MQQLVAKAAEHAHEGEGIWAEFIEILTDPAHLLAEVSMEIVFILLVHVLIIDRLAHRHHKKEEEDA